MKPLSLEDVEKITNDVIAKDATTSYNDCLDAVIAGIYDLGLARGLGEMFSEDEGAREEGDQMRRSVRGTLEDVLEWA